MQKKKKQPHNPNQSQDLLSLERLEGKKPALGSFGAGRAVALCRASPSPTNRSQLSPVMAWFGDEGTALLLCLMAQGESRLPGEGKDLG